jgi:DNA uptake protein ComE-like DNA-binding protein
MRQRIRVFFIQSEKKSMKSSVYCTLATVLALLLGGASSFAADSKASAPRQAASKPKMTANSSSARLVDINTANPAELKNLPGISDAEAANIIAGRPYSSKADLAVRHIIDDGVYEGLKKLIIAKQPYKDAAKNAALYGKKP